MKAVHNFFPVSSHTNSWSNSITHTCFDINNNNITQKKKILKIGMFSYSISLFNINYEDLI